MYKPARVTSFVTPAEHKKPRSVTKNGRTQKTFEIVGTVRGHFKQKGTAETNANGLTVINDKITFTTWYKADFAAKDILTINGEDYEVIGTPENVEMRGRYSIITLEKMGGGA